MDSDQVKQPFHDLLDTDPTSDDFIPNWEIIQSLYSKNCDDGELMMLVDESIRLVAAERISQLAAELALARADISKLKAATKVPE